MVLSRGTLRRLTRTTIRELQGPLLRSLMFRATLLKRANEAITKEDLWTMIRSYEKTDEVNGQFIETSGPMGYLEALKIYLESRGVVFSEEVAGEIYEVSHLVTGLGKYILGLAWEESIVAYGTDTPLPEFECSEGVFIYSRLNVVNTFETGYDGDESGSPEPGLLDLDEEEIIERNERKQKGEW